IVKGEPMTADPTPTERELEILKILWERDEATVREVHEEISRFLPMVQNTVQSFLRTMEEKGLVRHRVEGRTFIYRPVFQRDKTNQRLVSRLLQRAFDGAVDQLVQSVLSLEQATPKELARLEALIADARKAKQEQEVEEQVP
ncbi:MAG: BlaI/MecI/CopY family transcriptional regulator, partial [Planctomycetota bacterium]